MTDPIERHLDDLDSSFALFRARAVNALRDAWTSVETMRQRLHEMETQRDGHRRALNQIAEMVHVVHEDPKIVAAVRKMVNPAPGTPARSADEAVALQRAAMLWPSDKLEADALVFALKCFVEELASGEEYVERAELIEAMLTRAGIKL